MAAVVRDFLSLESPTARRNGAGFRPCQGLWHRPEGRSPEVAFLATHYDVDFSEHYLAEPLAARGFGFLGWNTRFRGQESLFLLEHALLDIAVGIRWLRERAGVRTLVLLGNSGGGSLLAAYQSVAREPDLAPIFPGHHIPDAVRELPRADLYVSLNAHPGRPEVLTAWMDPSVTDETDPLSRDPALDPFDPRHGPPFAPEFVARYRAAQEARNHRITRFARAELERLRAGGAFDRVFPVFRTWADLRFLDPALDPSERPPGRCYAGDPRRASGTPFGIARAPTLRTWLSMWSLESSPCRGELHLPRILEPSLVIQSLADTGVFPGDARAIHDRLGTDDRTLLFVPGDHYLEDPPEARDEVADRIAAWVRARLPSARRA